MKEYIATFGLGQKLAGKYVVVKAESLDQANDIMYSIYSNKWSFIYTDKTSAGVGRWKLEEVPFGTPNK